MNGSKELAMEAILILAVFAMVALLAATEELSELEARDASNNTSDRLGA
jgi:hypothetical protein